MKKIIILIVIALSLTLNADTQTQDKKDRLLIAVKTLGGSCGSVDSYSEIPGYGGSRGKIHIYCTNGMNYTLTKDAYGYNLKER